MTTKAFQTFALSFSGTEEKPHFDRTAFKVTKKRIYATLHKSSLSANILLVPAEQKDFCEIDGANIYPVPNKWGEKGWTTFELENVSDEIVQAAIEAAYRAVF